MQEKITTNYDTEKFLHKHLNYYILYKHLFIPASLYTFLVHFSLKTNKTVKKENFRLTG